jgi:hypothetical protein
MFRVGEGGVVTESRSTKRFTLQNRAYDRIDSIGLASTKRLYGFNQDTNRTRFISRS